MPGEDYYSWSTTAASNGTADSAINWAEGQPRASVNNSSRSQMAAHAKNRNLLNGSIVTGGTASAQTFTSGVGYTVVPTGLQVLLKIGPTLTSVLGTATTLNMDGIGAVNIKNQRGDNVESGLVAGTYAHFIYDGTNWVWLEGEILTVINNTTTVLITQVIIASVADGGAPAAFADFTNLDSTKFHRYELVCSNIRPEITEAALTLNVSTDNGVTFPFVGVTGYNSAEVYHAQAQSYPDPGSVPASSWDQNDQGYMIISWPIDTTDSLNRYPASVVLELFNFRTGLAPVFSWRSTHYHGTSFSTHYTGTGISNYQTGANALRVWMTEGNILTGTFTLYGVPV